VILQTQRAGITPNMGGNGVSDKPGKPTGCAEAEFLLDSRLTGRSMACLNP